MAGARQIRSNARCVVRGVHAHGAHVLPARHQGEQVLEGLWRCIAHGGQYAYTRYAEESSCIASALCVAVRTDLSLERSGGAADIVMCAMLRIESNDRLKALGFRQVLQVHDEIILEVRNWSRFL